MTDEERVKLITQIASNFVISCDDARYIVKSFENLGKEFMMSEADKLFDKLGYKKIEDKYNIDFNKIYQFTNGNKIREQIRFCKLDKYIHIENYNFNTGITFGKFLDMQELQAINQKCKELGWIE